MGNEDLGSQIHTQIVNLEKTLWNHLYRAPEVQNGEMGMRPLLLDTMKPSKYGSGLSVTRNS